MFNKIIALMLSIFLIVTSFPRNGWGKSCLAPPIEASLMQAALRNPAEKVLPFKAPITFNAEDTMAIWPVPYWTALDMLQQLRNIDISNIILMTGKPETACKTLDDIFFCLQGLKGNKDKIINPKTGYLITAGEWNSLDLPFLSGRKIDEIVECEYLEDSTTSGCINNKFGPYSLVVLKQSGDKVVAVIPRKVYSEIFYHDIYSFFGNQIRDFSKSYDLIGVWFVDTKRIKESMRLPVITIENCRDFAMTFRYSDERYSSIVYPVDILKDELDKTRLLAKIATDNKMKFWSRFDLHDFVYMKGQMQELYFWLGNDGKIAQKIKEILGHILYYENEDRKNIDPTASSKQGPVIYTFPVIEHSGGSKVTTAKITLLLSLFLTFLFGFTNIEASRAGSGMKYLFIGGIIAVMLTAGKKILQYKAQERLKKYEENLFNHDEIASGFAVRALMSEKGIIGRIEAEKIIIEFLNNADTKKVSFGQKKMVIHEIADCLKDISRKDPQKARAKYYRIRDKITQFDIRNFFEETCFSKIESTPRRTRSTKASAEITPVAILQTILIGFASFAMILMIIIGHRDVVEIGVWGICTLVGSIEAMLVLWKKSKDKPDNSIDSTSISWRDEPEVIYYPFSSFDVEEILGLLNKFPNVKKIVVESRNVFGFMQLFQRYGAQNVEFLILKTREKKLFSTDERSKVILDVNLRGRMVEIALIENDILQDSTPGFKEKTVYFIHPWNKKDLGIHYYPILRDIKKGDYLYISSDLLNNDGYRATSLPFIFFGPSMVGLEEVERSRGFGTNFLNIAMGDIVFKKVKKIPPERYREVYYADLYFAIYNDPMLPTFPFFPELELGVLTLDEIGFFIFQCHEEHDCMLIWYRDAMIKLYREKTITFRDKLKDIEKMEIMRIFEKGGYHTQLKGYKRIFWRIQLKNFLGLEKNRVERFIERILLSSNAEIAREKCSLGPVPYPLSADSRLADKQRNSWQPGLAEGIISSPFQLAVFLLKQIKDFEKKLNDIKIDYTTNGKGYLDEDNEKEKLLNLIQAMLKQFQRTAYLCSRQELIELGEVIKEIHSERRNKNSYLADVYKQLQSMCNTALVHLQNQGIQPKKQDVTGGPAERKLQYSY